MTRNVTYRIKGLRNGAYLTDLHWPDDSPPNIIMRANGELKSSISGTFLPDDSFNWLRDELQPYIIIDGEEHSLGIFRPTTMSAGEKSFVRRVTATAYDRAWLCKAQKTETLLHLSAGAAYIDQIKKLLVHCGIINVLADTSAAVLPADREDWQIGTSYLTIINDLLTEIGFNPLWFDAEGFAHLERYAAPRAEAIKRTYSAQRGMQMLPMLRDYSEETDIFNAPNVFVCICDNADRSAVLTATAENASFGAKSILQRGMRIAQVEKVKQIADQASLQAYADKLRDENLMGTREVSISVPSEAGHGVGDVIAIDHPEIGGIYQETGWRLTLAAGQAMKITAKRAVIY